VPYFQWLCVSGLFYPANSYNLNILKVKGRSDLVLYLGIVKKVGIIIGLLIFVHYSVLAIVIFRAFFSVIAFFINSYYSGKFIKYSVGEQLIDIWKFLFLSAVMGLAIWIISTTTNTSDLLTLVYGVITGGVAYGMFIFLFERSMLKETYQLLRKLV
jgi:O-antigen/teichoic acid export membrane protein